MEHEYRFAAAMNWLMKLPEQAVTAEDLDTDGLDISAEALAELLAADEELYRAQLPQVKEHLAKFGDKLPAAVGAQLEALEQRLS